MGVASVNVAKNAMAIADHSIMSVRVFIGSLSFSVAAPRLVLRDVRAAVCFFLMN